MHLHSGGASRTASRSSLLGDEHPLRAGDAAANTAPDHPDEAKDFPDLSSIRLTPRARGEYAG
jgi:hypothetical protein